MKVEAKVAVKACTAAMAPKIMAVVSTALLLSGCAVAMLGGAARSGGSGSSASGGTTVPTSSGTPTGKSQAATDSSMSTAVRSRFAASPSLKTLKIVVDTHDGVVTLRGQVNTVEQRAAAQAEARAVVGVKGVNNQLTVR